METLVYLIKSTFVLLRLAAKYFDRFRQKTPRPVCTYEEGFILGVGAKIFTMVGPML